MKEEELVKLKELFEEQGISIMEKEAGALFTQTLNEHPEKILNIHDEFEFDSNLCMNCLGDCCFERGNLRHVIGDIDYIRQSNKLKHKTKAQILKKYFTIHFDRQVIPFISVKTIKRKFYGKYVEICPFWKWVKKGKGFGGICVLGQKYKPSICLLFPLGSLYYEDDNNQVYQYYYDTVCSSNKTTNKIPIKSFIGNHPERIEKFNIMMKEYMKIRKFINEQFDIVKKKAQNIKQEKDDIDEWKMRYLTIIFYIIYNDDTVLNSINKVLEAIKKDMLNPKLLDEIFKFLDLNNLLDDLSESINLIVFNRIKVKKQFLS